MKFFNTITRGTLLVMLLLLLGNTAWAQRTIKGKVTDAETGEGLVGASVTVVGTTRGAITDLDGNYSVDVPDGSRQLRFAYTGYSEQVIEIGTSNTYDIAMGANNALDEVVVVGYGTQRSREITSSVASVKAEEFNKGNINDASQLLQGKVAGLSITRPGNDPNGGFNIRLRGLSTLGQNTQPLIVIDGIPGLSLNSIDPNDIESVDVLKDASAAAIYGTRASSGVIIITTKKGKAGRTSVDYNGQASFEGIERRVNVLDAAEYARVIPGVTNLGSTTNWIDEITDPGYSQQHSLNLSGGNGQTTYRVTGAYRDVNGIARGSGFRQYNGALALQQKALNNRLTLTGNLSYVGREAELGFTEAFRYAIISNPTAPVRNADGTFYNFSGFEQFNPVAIIDQATNTDDINTMFANIRADLELVKGLTFSLSGNRARDLKTHEEYYSRDLFYRSLNRGLGRNEENVKTNDLLESFLTYNSDFGMLNLKALAGYSWQEFGERGSGIQAGGVNVDNFGTNNWAAYEDFAKGQASVFSYRNDHRLVAFFGRLNLGYDNTYFLTASLRREGSTRFGENNKWGLFPAVSGGIAFDKWLGENNALNSLKLRAGWGVTGAIPRDSYLSLAKVSPAGSSAYFDGAYLPSWGITGTNPNPDLKWERKSDINIGIDFGLFDYKLTGSLEWYRSTVSDLLYPLTVPNPPNILPVTWSNVGKLQNGGIELALSYAVNRNWTTSLAATRYERTKLLEFYRNFKSQEIAAVGAPGQNASFYQVLSIADGENTIGNFVALDVVRIGEDGQYVYRDAAGNETTDKDNAAKVIAGNAIPQYELGWTNTFNYGRFDAQIFLRGVFGHDLINEFRVFYESLGDNNGFNKVDTKYFDERNVSSNAYTSRSVEKADFLRLDNLTIGYSLPLRSGSWFTRARVFFAGQQLFTLTGYTGVDPSPRYVDSGPVDNGGREPVFKDPLAPGIDRRNTYFTTRTLTLGVNLGF